MRLVRPGANGVHAVTAAVWIAGACGPGSASKVAEDSGGDCPLGATGCPCTDGGACDAGLTCVSGMCLGPGGTASSSTSSAESTVGSSTASTGGEQTTSGSASPEDSGSGPPGTAGGTTGTTGPVTTGPSTTGAGASTGGGTGETTSSDATGSDGTTSGGGQPCQCGFSEWSYAWIANSAQGTISKINTRSMVEEGRYATGGFSPSRTSVSIDGKAVVVANRGTGIAKIWARPELCDPGKNGSAGLQTSSGPANVLPWGKDDCVAWFTAFPERTVQRPVAWTSGVQDPSTCAYEGQKVWTTTGSGGSMPAQCGANGVWVHRLDGETGVVEDTIHIPEAEFPCDHTGAGLNVGIGPYGGAVDREGNFWFHGYATNKVARIDAVTLDYEIFSFSGGYGIAMDTKNRVWFSQTISRFDYATKQWQTASVSTSGGLAQDFQGRIWAAGTAGVVWLDVETLAVGDDVPFPGMGQVKGVAVDIDGYVWAVRQDATSAYRIDPSDNSYVSVSGLNGPYTYSDFTGGSLFNLVCNAP